MTVFSTAIFIVMTVCTFPAESADATKTATVYGLQIELQVLPPEPFFTAKEVEARQGGNAKNHSLRKDGSHT